MIKKQTIILLFLICILHTSCVEDSNIQPPTVDKQLVVNCVLSNSEVQKASLSWSDEFHHSWLYDEVSEEAIVTLYEEGVMIGHFKKAGYYEWTIQCTPQAGKHYKLTIEIPDKPLIEAETVMPTIPPIYDDDPFGKKGKKSSTFSQIGALDYPVWMSALSSDKTGIDYVFEHPLLTEDSSAHLINVIGTSHIGEDSFNQYSSMYNEIGEDATTMGHKYYIRLIEGKSNTGEYPFDFVVEHLACTGYYVMFRSVSTTLDHYYKSTIEKMTFYEGEGDPVQWFDEHGSYTNIQNGLGIFGAYAEVSYYQNATSYVD